MENYRKKQSSVDHKRKREDNSHERFDSEESRYFNNNFLATVKGQNPGEQKKKSALSDNDHQEYLLTKASHETTTTSTKKRRSDSVDLDLIRSRMKVESRRDTLVTNCKHTNNNFKQGEDKRVLNSTTLLLPSSDGQKNQDSNMGQLPCIIIKLLPRSDGPGNNQDSDMETKTRQLPRIIIDDLIRKGGRELHHVCTKRLTETDVDKHQNRLNVINPDALLNALTSEERDRVKGEDHRGMEVEMMDVSGRNYSMNIRKRTYNAAPVINRQWSKLVRENGLSKDDVIQLWGYRRSDGAFSLVLNDGRKNGESWFCGQCGFKLFGRYMLLRNCNHEKKTEKETKISKNNNNILQSRVGYLS